jgi:hypothetical protein
VHGPKRGYAKLGVKRGKGDPMKTLKKWEGCRECGQNAKLLDSVQGTVLCVWCACEAGYILTDSQMSAEATA